MTTIKNLMGTGSSGIAAQAATGMLTAASNALTATGNSQGTALALPTDFNVFTTVAASTGAILQQATPTDWITVVNHGANALTVYPPVGGSISTLSTNAGFSVPSGKVAQFQALTASNFAASLSA